MKDVPPSWKEKVLNYLCGWFVCEPVVTKVPKPKPLEKEEDTKSEDCSIPPEESKPESKPKPKKSTPRKRSIAAGKKARAKRGKK